MPPFRDPYNHEQKLADLVARYERTRKRAHRAIASAEKKMFVLIVCALGLAGWTGALMDWSSALRLEQDRQDVPATATSEDATCRWQLHNVEGTARNRLATLESMSIDLRECDAALVECEADVDVLAGRLERDGLDTSIVETDHAHEMIRAMVHEASW